MRRHFFLAMIVALAGVLWPLVSEAAILTYVTQGRVTQITDSLGLLDFVAVTDTVTYRTTFDTAVPGIEPFPGFSGYYAASVSLSVGLTDFVIASAVMAIAHPLDLVNIESNFTVTIPGLNPEALVLMVLSDQAESDVLADTALPTAAYDLSRFASTYLQISFRAPPPTPGGYPIDLRVTATVDTFEIVPEPAALMLFAAGGLILAGKRSC